MPRGRQLISCTRNDLSSASFVGFVHTCDSQDESTRDRQLCPSQHACERARQSLDRKSFRLSGLSESLECGISYDMCTQARISRCCSCSHHPKNKRRPLYHRCKENNLRRSSRPTREVDPPSTTPLLHLSGRKMLTWRGLRCKTSAQQKI